MLLEGILFTYYANTVFQHRRSSLISNFIMITGYVILWLISMLWNPTLNLIAFGMINFLILYSAFRLSAKSALVHTLILTVFMMLADFFMAFFIDYQIQSMNLLKLPREKIWIQTLGSKSLYLIFIIILKYVIKDKNVYHEGKAGRMGLMIMPVFSMLFMFITMQIMPVLSDPQKKMLILLGVLTTISNVVVFWIYDNALMQSAQLHALQNMAHKNEMDLEAYKQIEQK